jgi:hypothetical protein
MGIVRCFGGGEQTGPVQSPAVLVTTSKPDLRCNTIGGSALGE